MGGGAHEETQGDVGPSAAPGSTTPFRFNFNVGGKAATSEVSVSQLLGAALTPASTTRQAGRQWPQRPPHAAACPPGLGVGIGGRLRVSLQLERQAMTDAEVEMLAAWFQVWGSVGRTGRDKRAA